MRRGAAAGLVGLSLLWGACGTASDDGAAGGGPGDAAAFCARWSEAKIVLQDDFDRQDESVVRTAVERAGDTLDEIGALVPTSLRADWSAAVAYQETVITLIDVANFQPERLRQELVDAAFGEGGVEAAAASSAQAISDLDAWALSECGGFCAMWPRLERALQMEPSGDQYRLRFEGEEEEALLLLAGDLVPAELLETWEAAARFKLALVDFLRSWDWEPPWPSFSQAENDRIMEEVYAWESVLGPYFADDEEWHRRGPDWAASQYVADRSAEMAEWVEANCESTGTSGLPGSVEVRYQQAEPGWLLMAALPPGTDPAGIEDASDFAAVACSEPHQAWETPPGGWWTADLLSRERGFEDPCTALHMDIWGAEVAVLPPGTYDLFAARFPNGMGRFGLYVPAPSECAVTSFTVGGDTTVDLPDLEPCDLGPLSGSPEEIARRSPPPQPTGSSGTLEVLLADYPEEGADVAGLHIVVLPQGVSLDEVALGEAWPVGSACMHLPPPEQLDPRVRQDIIAAGIAIPILPFPVIPGDLEQLCVGPQQIDRYRLDPARLAAGGYDVYARLWWEGEGGEQAWCGRITATVSGSTRAELPPLEEDCRW